MFDPIDYSRPAGWWCIACGMEWAPWPDYLVRQYCRNRLGVCVCIPVYLPIPEGQRPLVEDEVEGAEVVTLNMNDDECWYMDNKLIHCVDVYGDGWTFSDIAEFSTVKP